MITTMTFVTPDRVQSTPSARSAMPRVLGSALTSTEGNGRLHGTGPSIDASSGQDFVAGDRRDGTGVVVTRPTPVVVPTFGRPPV
ncbi:hypothetical protein [Arsenicicoccus sp. oral taxon 190]|uniref:hypothetical protein n=1 Tax=Arsenicicoccus sp. oral taxon 190 TaxID=1658671 RepID=UPI000679F46A|nr:hypothetical protein [Arsenicicoccus sp. oral taxon 190]AKT51399.1 hypothetical protein ADJ73_08830 [Arsenicicoccus sp. oral taxon 190]